ncbi:MAG: protein-L-isoaspartate(D-aspartate) O-methyltransferase [Bacteroidia bacterium]|nr:protein-L-isoaspartate(D-aspartate) O-methyltransferase [Bacteroidia bacterium]
MQNDTYRHQGLRKKLVELIRRKGIKDEKVLAAIGKIPRHLFLDPAFVEFAYEDQPFQIGEGQTISQPFTVAYQTALLEIKKGEKVLEIGTGSGYQSAVLEEMGARVFSIERQKALYEKVKKFLPSLGYIVKIFYGDGYKGLPTFAPFDKIIVTAAAPFIPDDLITQLKPGGILVIPVGAGETSVMNKVTKLPDGTIEKKELDYFRFVPMLENKKSKEV